MVKAQFVSPGEPGSPGAQTKRERVLEKRLGRHLLLLSIKVHGYLMGLAKRVLEQREPHNVSY